MPVDFEKPHRVPPEGREQPPKYFAADPTRNQPVGFTKIERKHLAVIESRIAYEKKWVADHPHYTDISRRRGEIAALIWALARIAQIERDEQCG